LKRFRFEHEAQEQWEVDRPASKEIVEWAKDWAPPLIWANNLEASKKFNEN
jgi:hypothetical protein